MPANPTGLPEAFAGFAAVAVVSGCMYLMSIDVTVASLIGSFWLGVLTSIGRSWMYPKGQSEK